MTTNALVTGASRGLGRAIANYLSRRGLNVLITSSDHGALQTVLSELKGNGHKAIVADFRSDEDIKNLVAATKTFCGSDGLSVLFNAAAATVDPESEAELHGTSDETLAAHLAISCKAPMMLLKGLKESLSTAKSSHAITMGTDWNIDGITGPPAFAASKAFAMEGWEQSKTEFLKVGCVLSVIVAGNVATYDVDWVEPKWTIDDNIKDVRAELGITRVPIAAIVQAFELIITAAMSAVTKIIVVPRDPEYEP